MCYRRCAALGSTATAQGPTDLRKVLETEVPSDGAGQDQPLFSPGSALFGRLLVLVALPRGAALPVRVRVKFVELQEDPECVLVLQYQLLACREQEMADL